MFKYVESWLNYNKRKTSNVKSIIKIGFDICKNYNAAWILFSLDNESYDHLKFWYFKALSDGKSTM